MTRVFKYIGDRRKVEDVVKRSKRGGGFDSYIQTDMPLFKPREGENVVRVMPAGWGGDKAMEDEWGEDWAIQIWVHYGVGPDNATYLCLNKMKNLACPVCDARGSVADEEERKALHPRTRYLCYVVDRDNEKAGPQLWAMPKTLNEALNASAIDRKTDSVVRIDEPKNGYDVIFHRQGSDQRTKYTGIKIERDPSPLHTEPARQAKWLGYIADDANLLPLLLNYYEADYIEKVLYGKVQAKPDDDEEEAAPPPRARTRARPPEPEPEEEEEAPPPPRARTRARPAPEPEPEEVEEEEEEAPLPRARTRARPAPEPEPEEELPFEEEEEAPRPAPSAQARQRLASLRRRN